MHPYHAVQASDHPEAGVALPRAGLGCFVQPPAGAVFHQHVVKGVFVRQTRSGVFALPAALDKSTRRIPERLRLLVF